MTLSIQPVTEENWRQIAALSLEEDQQINIESNQWSLLEAAYDNSLHWQPLALYQQQQVVGFAMIGAKDLGANSLWLDRLMIAADFQGQGLGKRFLAALLTYIQETQQVATVYLSIHTGNQVAAHLYTSMGFRDCHQQDPANGEWIYRYDY